MRGSRIIENLVVRGGSSGEEREPDMDRQEERELDMDLVVLCAETGRRKTAPAFVEESRGVVVWS